MTTDSNEQQGEAERCGVCKFHWNMIVMPGQTHNRNCPYFDERDAGSMCQGCRQRYKMDIEIPDSLWERIKPEGKPKGAGLLCGRCIFARVEALGEHGDLTLTPRASLAAIGGDAVKLHPEHRCNPLARAVMMEGRDWWIGELIEPVPEWPHETHCLHMKTPLKDVSFLCNVGDFEQLLVLANAVVNLENLPWLRAITAAAKARLQAPFSSVCIECGGSGKTVIGCVVDSSLTAPCATCGGTGRKLRTIADHEDKGIPDEEVFDRLFTEYHQMPRRHCAVHNREEYKYESLEHELHAAASSPPPAEPPPSHPFIVLSQDLFDALTIASHELRAAVEIGAANPIYAQALTIVDTMLKHDAHRLTAPAEPESERENQQ